MADTYDPEWESYKRNWSKRYLGRVRSIVHTVAMLRSEIDELAETMDGMAGIDYARDRVEGGADDEGLLRRIERMDALKAEYAAELEDNLQAQADAHRRPANVGQPMRAVLTYRYIEGKPWADVAIAMNYNEAYCRCELHDKGLLDLYPFIPHEFDEMPEALE